MELTPTTTIQDPSETKEALTEARKRLGASGPPGPMIPSGQTATDPPRRPMMDPTRFVVAGVVLLSLAVGVWLAMR
jgi:hypothetical protein